MSEAKIQIKVGAVEFSGEGEQKWLSEQLKTILEHLSTLSKVPSPSAGSGSQSTGTTPISGNLSLFLKEKNATTNQTKKFLATAAFLQSNGKTGLTTTDVTKALKDAIQTRLGNPSECLNANVSQGLCQKDGKQFFVTEPGFASINIAQ